MAWSGHVNQKVNETKACPTMLLVCAPVTKRTHWKNKSPPKPYLHKFLRKMGDLSKAKASQASSVGPFFFFFFGDLVFMGRGPRVRSRLPGKAFLFECLPFSSLLPPLLPTYARLLVFLLVVDNLQSRRQVQFHHRVRPPEGFCFKRLFALSFWYAGKMPENDLPCSCSPA